MRIFLLTESCQKPAKTYNKPRHIIDMAGLDVNYCAKSSFSSGTHVPFGRRSRPWLREREGPADVRTWEG